MHTHANFIVLPQWNTKLLAFQDLLSHSVALSWQWANQTLSYPNKAESQAREWELSILKPLVWLDHGSKMRDPDSNLWPSKSLISQNGRWTLYSLPQMVLCYIQHSSLTILFHMLPHLFPLLNMQPIFRTTLHHAQIRTQETYCIGSTICDYDNIRQYPKIKKNTWWNNQLYIRIPETQRELDMSFLIILV